MHTYTSVSAKTAKANLEVGAVLPSGVATGIVITEQGAAKGLGMFLFNC